MKLPVEPAYGAHSGLLRQRIPEMLPLGICPSPCAVIFYISGGREAEEEEQEEKNLRFYSQRRKVTQRARKEEKED